MCFHVQLSLVNPKDLVFFCRQDQKATGGAEIYIFDGWRSSTYCRCTLRDAFLMSWLAWQFWNVFSCSNQTVFVNPKNLYFSDVDSQKVTGRTKTYTRYFLTVWRINVRRYALRSAFLMSWSHYWSTLFATSMESEWYGVYHSFRGVVKWLWENEVFSLTTEMEFHNRMKLSLVPRERSWVCLCWLIVITYPSQQ